MMSYRALLIGLMATTTLALGCKSVRVHRGDHEAEVYREWDQAGGPPPWAPAHGYRRKTSYDYYYE